MEQTKQPTCAELVESAYQSRTNDIKRLWAAECDPDEGGPMYTKPGTITDYCEDCMPPNAKDVWKEAARPTVCDTCNQDWPTKDGSLEDIGSLNEYGLSFDYVTLGTFNDQKEGYFRYQISWGGPSEEYRFFTNGPRFDVYRVEFWYLDWFDGAPRDCTSNQTLADWFEMMREAGSLDHEYERATA